MLIIPEGEWSFINALSHTFNKVLIDNVSTYQTKELYVMILDKLNFVLKHFSDFEGSAKLL